MITVSYHACLRYAERVMGIKDVKELTPAQVDAISVKIVQELQPYINQIRSLRSGSFTINGFSYKITELSVVTVTYIITDEDNHSTKRVRGGRMRSGSKLKKKIVLSARDREDAKWNK